MSPELYDSAAFKIKPEEDSRYIGKGKLGPILGWPGCQDKKNVFFQQEFSIKEYIRSPVSSWKQKQR